MRAAGTISSAHTGGIAGRWSTRAQDKAGHLNDLSRFDTTNLNDKDGADDEIHDGACQADDCGQRYDELEQLLAAAIALGTHHCDRHCHRVPHTHNISARGCSGFGRQSSQHLRERLEGVVQGMFAHL